MTDWKTAVEALTDREKECVAVIAEGIPLKEVARKLFRSRKTVENHLSHAHKKLGVHSRVQLVRVAVASGLVPVEFEVGA